MIEPLESDLDPDSLLTVLPFPALLLDSNLVIRKANSIWLDYLGYQTEQVQGQALKDFLPEQEQVSSFPQFQALKKAPGSTRFRCRFYHQNGSILEFICGGTPLSGQQENDLVTLWILIPVNQAGDPLDDESMSWLNQSRGLMSHLPAAVSIKDADEQILFVNQLFSAMIGKTPRELIGLYSDQITPPELQEQYHEENQRVLQGEEIREESVFPGPEGPTYWLTDKFPIRTPDGSVLVGSISFEITERVQAELALEKLQADLLESEERFRMLAENSLDIIALIDPDFKLEYLSPASERITGYNQDNFQNRDIFEIIHPDDLPDLQQTIQSSLENQLEMHQSTFRIINNQDQIRWIEASAAYTYNKEELESILVHMRDVTDRMKIQQALEESERQKDLILNATSEMVAYYKPDLRIIWANNAAAESVGKEPGQLVGMYCHEVWHQSDQPCSDCPVLKARETGIPQQTEQITPDGRYWRIRGFPVKDEEGKVLGMVEFGQDITSQKRAEKALAISRERFRDLYRKTPVMLHSINAEGKLVEVTDYWLEVMGYDREDVIGLPSTDFLTEKSRKYAEEVALPEFFQNGQARDVHYQFVTKSGQVLDILMSAVGEWDQDGNFIRSLAVMEDVTERLAAQQRLRESEEKYRRLVDGSPNIHYIYSVQSGAKFWSRRVKDILGYQPDDFIREPFRWTDSIHPEDQENITRRMNEISPGDTFDLEYRIVDSSGNWHWIRDRSINITRVSGEVLIEGVAEDITRRKRLEIIRDFHLELVSLSSDEPAEHLLQYALDRAEKVTGSSRGLALIMDPEEQTPTIQIWSTRTQAASWDPPLEKDQHPPLRHAGVWEEAVKIKQPVIYNDLEEIVKKRGISADHHPIQRELVVPVTRNNRVVAVFAVGNKENDYDLDDLEIVARISDLTWEFAAEQQARDELRKSEKRYRGIVEDQSEMICRFDRQGTLNFVNRAYADFLGKDVDELLGMDLFGVIPIGDRTRVRKMLLQLTPENPQNRNRNLNSNAAGKLRWVEWTNRAIFDQNGNLQEYQSVGYDIHDQLKLQQALKESEQDYRELVHYLQETREDERSLVAREIHDEFGQVLTAMKFDLDWLLKQDKFAAGPTGDRLRAMTEMVDKTQAQVRKIGTRLRPDMLDNLGLQAALEWQLEDFSKRVNIQSTFEFTGEEDLIPPEIEIDIYRLVQEALTNITRHAGADQVVVNIQVDRESINCRIEDNGVGFDREEFDSRKSFGIISMRERVYRWDGNFEIRGEPGRGTKITVLIPLQGEQHD